MAIKWPSNGSCKRLAQSAGPFIERVNMNIHCGFYPAFWINSSALSRVWNQGFILSPTGYER